VTTERGERTLIATAAAVACSGTLASVAGVPGAGAIAALLCLVLCARAWTTARRRAEQAIEAMTAAEQMALAAEGVSAREADGDRRAQAAEVVDEGRQALAGSRGGVEGCASSIAELGGNVDDAASRIDVARSMTFQILGQISELGDMSDRIAGMVVVIRKITEQTNLLALNATIEAARAGDLGKGFAIVASEVRKLAQDSREATEAIDAIVSEIREMTEATIEVANLASEEVEGSKNSFASVRAQVDGAAAQLSAVIDSLESGATRIGSLMAGLGGERDLNVAPESRFGIHGEELVHVVH